MPPDFQALHSSLSVKEQILARPLSKQTIAGYALLSDIYSKPALLLWVIYLEDLRTRSEQSVLSDRISPSDGASVWWDNPAASRAIDPVPEGALERKRYRAVVTQASEGIFLVDADTKHF